MPAEIHASVVRLRSAAEAEYRHIHTRTGDPDAAASGGGDALRPVDMVERPLEHRGGTVPTLRD